MFHWFGVVQNTRGDSLPGWQVGLVDLNGINVMIFADENSTPIDTVSGIPNRAVADDFGNYDFFVPSGTYTLQFFNREGEFQRAQRFVAMYGEDFTTGLIADLASNAVGEGAGLIGTTDGGTVQAALNARPTSATLAASGGAALIGKAGGGTVQDGLNALQDIDASLLDLTNVLSVTSATQLAISDLNRLVIAGGSTSYTVNLPNASVAGSALKLEIARTATGVVTIQAAAGSGKLVNGNVLLDMIAGESALFVYDGTNWRTFDWARVPILAEMINTASAAQSLTTDVFNDVSMGTAGVQLMATDLSALWNVSGGYFTAPREMICRIDLHIWVSHSTGPGQYDIGVYFGATGGGAPNPRYFSRISAGTEAFRTLTFSVVRNVLKGAKLFPTIQPLSPLTAAQVVDGSIVESRVTVTELFRA